MAAPPNYLREALSLPHNFTLHYVLSISASVGGGSEKWAVLTPCTCLCVTCALVLPSNCCMATGFSLFQSGLLGELVTILGKEVPAAKSITRKT